MNKESKKLLNCILCVYTLVFKMQKKASFSFHELVV